MAGYPKDDYIEQLCDQVDWEDELDNDIGGKFSPYEGEEFQPTWSSE